MNRYWKCTLVAACVSIGLYNMHHLHEFAQAQDEAGGYSALGGGPGGAMSNGKAKPFETPPEMHKAAQEAKTVEDIRKFDLDSHSAFVFNLNGDLDTGAGGDVGMGAGGVIPGRFPTLPEASARLNQLRNGLRDPKSDRAGLEPELDKALNAYFVVDMKSRVTELDKIKERVKEMEAQLERRMKSKDEIIDLQKKVILSESNGLGFFSAASEAGNAWMGGPEGYQGGIGSGGYGTSPGMKPSATGPTPGR